MTGDSAASTRHQSAPRSAGLGADDIVAYLDECRERVVEEIRSLVPRNPRYGPVLYDLVLEYPLRHAKGLRPALCLATCRALGGSLDAALRSAATLELYHNAFLIHDDVEDGSELRRGHPTLHRAHGVPIAINVGDAMLALALRPLLDNTAVVGLGRALRILEVVSGMARASAEGQALELAWVRDGRWDLSDADYVRMVYRKTSWYTFVAPVLVGGIIAGASKRALRPWRAFAAALGIAFQVQDDVLNLTADPARYGKEIGGDLWEGKRTLALSHFLRTTTPEVREWTEQVLRKPRRGLTPAAAPTKTPDEVTLLLALITSAGSLDHARRTARQWTARASRHLAQATRECPSTVHQDLLWGLLDFVVERDH